MFNLFKKSSEDESSYREAKRLVTAIHQSTKRVYSANDLTGVREYEALKKSPHEKQKEIILQLTDLITVLSIKQTELRERGHYSYQPNNIIAYGREIASAVQNGLMRSKLQYNETEWMELFSGFRSSVDQLAGFDNYYHSLHSFPINHAIKQIEYYLKDHERSEALTSFVQKMLSWGEFGTSVDKSYYGSDLEKAAKKLRALIVNEGETPKFRLRTDDIGSMVNQILDSIDDHQEDFSQIFDLASGATGSKPSQKFSKTTAQLQDKIGLDQFRKIAQEILAIPITLKSKETVTAHQYNGTTYHHTEITFLCSPSQQLIKGLVWTMDRYSDKETIQLLSKLCEKSYTKLPGIGPSAASVGNACILVLGNMRGRDGLGALSRLKLKLRQNNVRKSIDKQLEEGAKKYNVSVEELKEMAVPDFNLEKGSKTLAFEEYQLSISVQGNKVVQQFFKPDGTPMKSVPNTVKKSSPLASKLGDVRKEVKEIQKVLTAQKQRIDNQFILERKWELASFKRFYLDHGLVYPIVAKMIWTFTKEEQSADAILLDGKWYTVEDQLVDWIDDQVTVKLWHPVNSDEATITAWRKKILDLRWKQPVKQAFREIYILTEAEVKTRTYSNRMAAHILKQHQFNTLASLRDWKYSLLGAYDDGRDNEICQKHLPEYDITAEYWIDELYQDGAWNDTGIWLYIATDQVKFKNKNGEVMDLVDVPKMVFTEIMRDVDMFVGVCSVGNDPQWIDNNGERQANHDYWTSYSFGDLNEIAKTRKIVLQSLLPRLTKIRDKARTDGKFLIVDGTIRTYKIHIGSGNILMEPNDQYLCIVPARSAETTADKLFIPFDGDKGFSIVLSKAFLLAEDHKITDSSIVSQINR